MAGAIQQITLHGFKSIKSLVDFPLNRLNVLIGANGAGKSNFVSIFTFIREMVSGHLEKTVNLAGRADGLLHLGPKATSQIQIQLNFGENTYEVSLERTADSRLIFADERILWHDPMPERGRSVNRSLGTGHSESKLKMQIVAGEKNRHIAEHIYNSIIRWIVYHVHDTSTTSSMRGLCTIRDTDHLRHDCGNLAPFLMNLRNQARGSYDLIRDIIRLIAPFFDDFLFRPKKLNGDEFVELEWKQKGSDFPFHPMHLSDGTLRFIALATALLQPKPPLTILIDEPELGLHPYAITLLADLIQSASTRTQLIISTQSPTLLDYFLPEDIVVVNRHEGQTTFERLDSVALDQWLDDYSVGELWQKNVVRAGPSHE